jgi:hypothetical protein
MQTKTKQKYSTNFLNNQNYILGKREKKKVLSKFFVERILKSIIKILTYFIKILKIKKLKINY